MKLRASLLAVAAAALAVTVVVAPAAGKGKPPTTGPGCKPAVTLIVKGATTAAAGPSSLSTNITGGNRFAKVLFAHDTSTALTVNTTASTKVTTDTGQATTLASITSGSKVLVQYRVCKADLKTNNTSTLLSSFLSLLSPKKVVTLGS